MSTATTHSAKEHARSQATLAPAPTAPEGVSELTWAESVPGGSYTTKVLARGTRLRLVDVDGAARQPSRVARRESLAIRCSTSPSSSLFAPAS